MRDVVEQCDADSCDGMMTAGEEERKEEKSDGCEKKQRRTSGSASFVRQDDRLVPLATPPTQS